MFPYWKNVVQSTQATQATQMISVIDMNRAAHQAYQAAKKPASKQEPWMVCPGAGFEDPQQIEVV